MKNKYMLFTTALLLATGHALAQRPITNVNKTTNPSSPTTPVVAKKTISDIVVRPLRDQKGKVQHAGGKIVDEPVIDARNKALSTINQGKWYKAQDQYTANDFSKKAYLAVFKIYPKTINLQYSAGCAANDQIAIQAAQKILEKNMRHLAVVQQVTKSGNIYGTGVMHVIDPSNPSIASLNGVMWPAKVTTNDEYSMDFIGNIQKVDGNNTVVGVEIRGNVSLTDDVEVTGSQAFKTDHDHIKSAVQFTIQNSSTGCFAIAEGVVYRSEFFLDGTFSPVVNVAIDSENLYTTVSTAPVNATFGDDQERTILAISETLTKVRALLASEANLKESALAQVKELQQKVESLQLKIEAWTGYAESLEGLKTYLEEKLAEANRQLDKILLADKHTIPAKQVSEGLDRGNRDASEKEKEKAKQAATERLNKLNKWIEKGTKDLSEAEEDAKKIGKDGNPTNKAIRASKDAAQIRADLILWNREKSYIETEVLKTKIKESAPQLKQKPNGA